MKEDVEEYLPRCIECQQVKVAHQYPTGLLQPLPIPKWKWEIISMDFITGLPKNFKQHDSTMVVVDNLRKEVHFIPVKSTYKGVNIANTFMKEVFRLHGVPRVIISDRDAKFTQNYWKYLFKGLGTTIELQCCVSSANKWED